MNFLEQLNKRKVLRTAGLYVVGAWLALQAAEVLVGLNVLPESVGRPLFVVLVIGFPIVVLLSWFLRWTPKGLSPEDSSDTETSSSADTVRTVVIIGLAAVLGIGVTAFLRDQGFDVETGSGQVTMAVLPLATVGPKGSEEYWADGITEQLIGMIARIPGVAVTSRTSAFSLKNSTASVPEIADMLSVNYVLSGSVQHDKEKIRVRVELIDAGKDIQIWSDSFDLAEQSIFEAQDEITASVGTALQLKLSGGEASSITTDPEAYKLFLQGSYAQREGSEAGFARALELCQQSLKIDPLYAKAWECVAAAYSNQANRHQIEQSHGYELALHAADRALEIDPTSIYAHQTIGYVQNYYYGDLQASADAYQAILNLSPASPPSGYALLLASTGYFQKAVEISEAVALRDPLNPISQANLAACYFWNKQWDDALDRYQFVLAMEPDYFAGNYRISENLLFLGRNEEALEYANREKHEVYKIIGQALVHQSLGNQETADQLTATLESNHGDIAAYNIAYVKAHRGDIDGAFDFLERELELSGAGVFSEILGDHLFENLHSDPRWPAFLKKIGRAPEQLRELNLSL